MANRRNTDNNTRQPAVTFAEFWQFMASQLGSSRLKINTKAESIHQFLDTDTDPKDYLRDAIKQSYKRNRCNHLRSAINVNAVLDILGETAYTLQSNHNDDLMDIELLEEIAWNISERYESFIEMPELKTHRSKTYQQAQVMSLPKARVRRANLKI